MLCPDGKISLSTYLGIILAFTPLCFLNITSSFHTDYTTFLAPTVFYILANVVVKCLYRDHDYQVAWRATFLGFVFSLGIYIYNLAPKHLYIFGLYMCVMSFFHYSEFLSIAIIQPRELSTNSFLLYHSPQYVAAAVCSWLEFAVESYFFPELKMLTTISFIGLGICLIGEFLRKLAMLTARSNFNHLVQCTKSDSHILVTHGVYGLFRHPSYVGWFYWSIATQIILINPLCVIAYALASWHFFNERINIEEITLLNFFGQQYCEYQQRVNTGLPFIHGFRIKP